MNSNETPTHRIVALALAFALLTACGGEPEPGALTPAQADEALSLKQQYDAARTAHDFEGATKIADRLRKKYPDSEEMKKVRESLDDTIKRADLAASANRLANLWEYQAVQAGGGTQYTALIPSHTETDENGLPAGPADARLVLRVHPEWGKSAYLLLGQRQFACGEPCTMQIAFDDQPAETFVGKQADSGNGPALFIEERERFYAAMQSAQVVKIILPKTGTPVPTLKFDVGGYDANRLGTEF
jgi:soluble cytochrome b562